MPTADNFLPKSRLKMADIVKSRFWSKEKESQLQNEVSTSPISPKQLRTSAPG